MKLSHPKRSPDPAKPGASGPRNQGPMAENVPSNSFLPYMDPLNQSLLEEKEPRIYWLYQILKGTRRYQKILHIFWTANS